MSKTIKKSKKESPSEKKISRLLKKISKLEKEINWWHSYGEYVKYYSFSIDQNACDHADSQT